MPASSSTLQLGSGRSLHLATAGEGPDILLLHGAFATHWDWLTGPFDALAGLGRVIAIDRPGHGDSRRGRFEGSPRAQATQILAALQILKIEKPLVIGHSFGGLVALAMAEQEPDALSSLILLAPVAFPEVRPLEHSLLAPRAAPFFGPLTAKMTAPVFDRPMLEMLHRVMFWPDTPPEAWKRTYPWHQIVDDDAGVANAEDFAAIHPLAFRTLPDVRKISLPVHVMSGTADLVVRGERQAEPLARMLPEGRSTRLPGVGHMVHHSRPDAVLGAVREALEPERQNALAATC